MRVEAASESFVYGPRPGAGALFRSDLHHASVSPASERVHLKMAYFFKLKNRSTRSQVIELKEQAVNDATIRTGGLVDSSSD